MFHVAFREFLQEQILAKMKRPPLVDEEDWEGETVEEGGEGQWVRFYTSTFLSSFVLL